MADLSSQLTDIFKAGLDSNPDLAKSLAGAIQDDLGTGGKQTKAEANYRTADGSECCAKCEHFDGKSSCEVVSGHISSDGVSDSYEPAASGPESSSSKDASSTSDSGSSQDSSSDTESTSEDSKEPGEE